MSAFYLYYVNFLYYEIDTFQPYRFLDQLENGEKKSAPLTLGTTNKPLYTIHNVSIVNCRSYRDLGIKFDPSLHFSEHIGVCCISTYCIIKRLISMDASSIINIKKINYNTRGYAN